MADSAPEFLTGQFIGEGHIETFTANAALTKGDVVKILTADRSVSASSSNDKSIGVALKTVSSGQATPVLVFGKTKLLAGGAITRGAAVKAVTKTAGNGVVVAAVNTVTIPSGATAVTSTSAQPSMTVESGIALGVALDSTAADGDAFLALINGVG